MTPMELLNELTERGVILEPRGERLHVEAPRGVLTPEFRQALIEHKPEILAMLRPCCPTCGERLRITETDRYTYQECPTEPVHLFRLENKRPSKPMGYFTDYEPDGTCHACGHRCEAYSGYCENCLKR